MYNDGYDSESITQRFKSYLQDIVREYSLMSEMKGHTNIVYCDDLRYVQHDDGMGWDIYIKMELLTPLPKILGNGFSEKLIIKLGLDICNALILCKSKNIVHRDIKPQNIFVSSDGDFKLGDFGIAKTAERTTSGTKTGTYKYMAPEVYNNQPYGHSVDIYSLGMVLYWLLNERRTPFLPLPPKVPTATDEDRARDLRFAGIPIPEPLHGSNALKRIVLKACAFLPEERYKRADEMRKDLLVLANNDMCTSQNQQIESAGENESGAQKSDTDATVGNFCCVQKGKSTSEKTVGAFTHRTANVPKKNSKKRSKILRNALMLIATLISILLLAFGSFSWGKRENAEHQLSTQASTQSSASTSLNTAITQTSDVGIEIAPERLAILMNCDHIFEVINTPEGIATSCRFCGASMEEVAAAGVPLKDVECEHTFEAIIQDNGTPAFECSQCHSIQIMPIAPLANLKKLSDTNDGEKNEDVIVGASCKFEGMEITDAVRFWVINAAGYSNSESVEFYLANSYSTLSGIVFAGTESDDGADMTLRFYGDGNLIEEITDITADDSYFPKIDVSGVEVLRIECTTSWKVHSYCYIEASVAY